MQQVNPNHTNSQIDQRKKAWLRIQRAIGSTAQVAFFAASLGALAMAPIDPSVFLTSLGVNLLSNLLDRIAHGQDISNDEIVRQVQEAIQQSNIATEIKLGNIQSLIARQFHRFDLLEYAIDQGESRVAQLIIEQASQYQTLLDGLQGTLAEINAKSDLILNSQATHEQADELLVLVRKVLSNIDQESLALSAIPRTSRPILASTLIGRDEDLDWFRFAEGDKLLVGQPGSGKTSLFRKLVGEGYGLFVVDRQRSELFRAIRLRKPKIVIIDDDLNDDELLLDLYQLRQQEKFAFAIWVSCWPGDRNRIIKALHLTASQIRDLTLLDRDQIVEVIKTAGLRGPNALIREIVDQAGGRPGLAVTLVDLCRSNDIQKVIRGEVLHTQILPLFKGAIGSKAIDILAAFSVGGDSGMSMEAVSNCLRLDLIEARNAVVTFDLGGVFLELDHRYIAVHPRPLREVIVGEVFFQGAKSYSIEPFLKEVPNLSQALITIIGAKARKANVPSEWLIGRIESLSSLEVWRAYAGLGSAEAAWVLENHPEYLISLARIFLYYIPERVIPLLMRSAIGDERPLNSSPDSPLRLIRDWVLEADPGSGEPVKRRRLLLEEMKKWLLSGEDIPIALRLIPTVLSPYFDDVESDPGSGMKMALRSAYLLPQEILEIQSLWKEIFQSAGSILLAGWSPLRTVLDDWAFNTKGFAPSEQVGVLKRSLAAIILRDIASLATNRAGILHSLRQINRRTELGVEIQADVEFETLYPDADLSTHYASDKDRTAVYEMALTFSNTDPQKTLQKLSLIEQEARNAGVNWPRATPLLCHHIAENLQSPLSWLNEAIKVDLAPDLVSPFLWKAAEINEEGWIDSAKACLGRPSLWGLVISLALTKPNVPKDLITFVLLNLNGYEETVKHCCLRKQVPDEILMDLLRHSNKAVARATASGMWWANPKGQFQESLREMWENVIVDWYEDEEDTLTDVLRSNPNLAFRWLKSRLSEDKQGVYRIHEVFSVASLLDIEPRQRLLHELPLNAVGYEMIGFLVQDDLSLYQELLNNKRLAQFHLIPLVGSIDEIWIEKAKLALSVGYTTTEIAEGSFGHIFSWAGKESNMWLEWVKSFEQLEKHDNAQICDIGAVGKAKASERYRTALERERRQAIYGRD